MKQILRNLKSMQGDIFNICMWTIVPNWIFHSVEQGKKNLREVTVIHLEEAERQGRLAEHLQSAGLDEIGGALSSRRELVGFTPIELAV